MPNIALLDNDSELGWRMCNHRACARRATLTLPFRNVENGEGQTYFCASHAAEVYYVMLLMQAMIELENE